ncbi:hypothetical protein AUC68_09735 [Methyloceanibacter methanicus]|uniref:Two-component system response regulator n=1 Tax=Methyloceanibacter methanicus TaxID=1774968 RepID=A0A1E3W0R8_9HYPH|nr:hypothetical protein AUC68_09735 [Methyloceanibacter methanicus]
MLIVDDHPIVVAGFRRLLHDAGWHAVEHTSSFAKAFRLCRRARPEAVVVDLAMSAGSLAGLSFVRRLRRYDSDIPILVLSMHDDPLIARAALKAGANGYVVKDTSPEELVQGLAAILHGTPYVSRVLASDLAFHKTHAPESMAIDALSSRERYVLSLLAEGKSYAQIADNLALSYKAVAHLCNRLKPKLGVQSLQELVRFAVQNFPAASTTTRKPAKHPKDSG